MKWPESLDNTDFRQFLGSVAQGPLIESPWPCDPLGTCAQLIAAHNAYSRQNGWAIEDKFLNTHEPIQQLSNLLWSDFEYLKKGTPVLEEIAPKLVFAEAAVPTPNAFHLEVDDDRTVYHSIVFHSPLIHFLNSAFSKIFVLMHDNRYAESLPSDRHLFDESEYSDTNLLACLFNDVELLFREERLYVPFAPSHAATPYDYCEWVEGARRFVLAHELGHAMYSSSQKPKDIEDLIPAGTLGIDVETWHEEYWCDAFGVLSILRAYEGRDLNTPGGELYECQNSLIGTLLFFTIVNIVDSVLGNHLTPSPSHPPAKARRDVIRQIIKNHPVFLQNDFLPNILTAKWRRINSFREFVAGANAPIVANNSLWSSSDFRTKLSPFGMKAYRDLFDSLSFELVLFYDGDRSAQRLDAEYF